MHAIKSCWSNFPTFHCPKARNAFKSTIIKNFKQSQAKVGNRAHLVPSPGPGHLSLGESFSRPVVFQRGWCHFHSHTIYRRDGWRGLRQVGVSSLRPGQGGVHSTVDRAPPSRSTGITTTTMARCHLVFFFHHDENRTQKGPRSNSIVNQQHPHKFTPWNAPTHTPTQREEESRWKSWRKFSFVFRA